MRKTVLVLLGAALAMSWVTSAEEPAASAARSAKDSTVIAGLNALPSAPVVLPVSSATSALPAVNSVMSPALAPIIAVAPATPASTQTAPSLSLEMPGKHPFFDKSNLGIFAALAAGRTMDLISTWQFRRHGLNEGELTNAFVDNKPLFATYSASLVAGQISASYVFHRLGWHRVERLAVDHTYRGRNRSGDSQLPNRRKTLVHFPEMLHPGNQRHFERAPCFGASRSCGFFCRGKHKIPPLRA